MSFTLATTVDEALAALAGGAVPVAGGTDLVVGSRQGKTPLHHDLVAIDRISSLASIDIADHGLAIGALTTHAQLVKDAAVRDGATALADAAALIGSPSTRNVGTIGGNIMNGSPAMDTGAPLVVLGAEVELRSVDGQRILPIGDLWAGPGRTTASAGELCTRVLVPAAQDRSGSAYVRLEYRRAMEIAVVGAAAWVALGGGGDITDVRVALTAVAPTILPVAGLGDAQGSVADVAATAAAAARTVAVPISDLRASDGYRRHCVGVMARRAVEAAARRAAGESIAIPVNRALGIGAG